MSERIVNVEQARGWDGPEGQNWTDNEGFYNEATRYLTPHLFAAAAIEPAERVLDIGCGCGETTRIAARAAPHGEAFGIDLSSRMIERARERATEEGLANARFEHGDAQVYPFEPDSFDVMISRDGVMFFDDPIAAFTSIGRALTTGGRLAMLCWRDLAANEWVSEILAAIIGTSDLPEPPPGAPGPFGLSDPDRVRTILGEAGFDDLTIEPVDEPLYLGPDVDRCYEDLLRLSVVAGSVRDLDDGARAAVLDRLREAVRNKQGPEGVLFGSGSWLVCATAR